jgi:hypothetical protein
MMPDMDPYTLACGASAEFDYSSGFSYRCTECGAVVGSVGMPRRCKDEEEKVKIWEILSGKEKR